MPLKVIKILNIPAALRNSAFAYRSSHPEVFLKIGAVKILEKSKENICKEVHIWSN